MIYETFTCSTADGTIEYGFTFKEDAECEDTLFDLVLGSVIPSKANSIPEQWAQHEWAAKAVVAAAPN